MSCRGLKDMDRLALLSEGGQHDDQVLETDIMRFMAIIGMVFWIIFVLIKSIPFRSPGPDMGTGQLISSRPLPNKNHQIVKKRCFINGIKIIC